MSAHRRLRVSILGLFSLALLLGWNISFAQSEESRYFPETGHIVSGEFLRFYEQVTNAEFVFGYPITDAFTDQTTGMLVQYFQRVRFEWHPDEEPILQVQLSSLGDLLYEPGQPLPTLPNASACKDYPTGYQVCYAFLEFFEAHGGESQFGFPISNFEIQDGRIVQYFNRARFSWHPELAPGQKVRLSDLGRIYFYEHREDPERLLSNPDENIIAPPTSLRVRAFTEKAVVALDGDTQTLSVIVQDQNLQPLPQAHVDVILRFPNGQERRDLMPSTDENGVSKLTFTIEADDIGLIEIEVNASLGDLSDQTRTSFRVWY